MNKKIIFPLILASSSIFLSACGKPDPNQEIDNPESGLEKVEQQAAEAGFWNEFAGIGGRLAYYQFSDHTLRPKNQVFILNDTTNPSAEETYFIHIKKIKDRAHPDSIIEIAKGNALPQQVKIPAIDESNPKQACISLTTDPPSLNDCSHPYDFMIVSPIYPILSFLPIQKGNFTILTTNSSKTRRFYALNGKQEDKNHLTIADAQNAWGAGHTPPTSSPIVEVKNAYAVDMENQSRVSSALDGYVQIMLTWASPTPDTSAKAKANAWTYKSTSFDNASFKILCASLTNDFDHETSRVFSESKETTLDLTGLQKGKYYGISFCGGRDKTEGDSSFKEVTFNEGLPPIDTTLFNTSKGKIPYQEDLYLYVDNQGKHRFIVSPISVAWAFGKKYNIKSLDDNKLKKIKIGVGELSIIMQ